MASFMDKPEHECRDFIDGFLAKTMSLPDTIRPIDRVKIRTRSRPMKVLCLGFSRTGTFSLFHALTALGFRPYHMAEALANAAVDFPCWQQALEAKFLQKGNAKPWGREEFDKILGDFDAVLDIPCINFAEELIAAYPEAKIVLTERDADAWIKSIGGSVAPVWSWKSWDYVAWADPVMVSPFLSFANVVNEVVPFKDAAPGKDSSRLKKVFLEHNQHIRDITPKEKLLVKPLGSGWEELCPFLGIDIPEFPYPNVNDSAFFVAFHAQMIKRATWLALGKIAPFVVPAATAAAFLAYRSPLIRS